MSAPAPVLGDEGEFDSNAMELLTGTSWFWEEFLGYPQRIMGALRFLKRVVHIPFTGWYFVLRHDDVREVLNHDREFPVPWSGKMLELTHGRNFVLGMTRGAHYSARYAELAEAFPLADVRDQVEAASARIAERRLGEVAARTLDPARPRDPVRFDAIQDLVAAVPAEICETYFGIKVPRKDEFAKWTIAISAYIFTPDNKPALVRLGRGGGTLLRQAIRDAIPPRGQPGAGLAMTRLAALRDAGHIDEEAIAAHMFGMVMGFIPTDVLAAGNMLETLLRRPDFMERTRAAALADDDELLWRCLREALRFRHINGGPWRHCSQDYTFPATPRGTGFTYFGNKAYTIPGHSDTKVLALIQSASFDARRIERANVFDPDRPDEHYMTFGVGQHWCIGAYIAKAQITQTLKPLLKKEGLRAVDPAVRTLRYNDFYPMHLQVEFDR